MYDGVECSDPECDRQAVSRGMCQRHWMSWRRKQKALGQLKRSDETWHKITARADDGATGVCAKCGVVELYSFRQRDTVVYVCKDRERERSRAKIRATNLRKYGLTPDQYDDILEEQSGVCAICGNTCATGRNLAVDHCHTTGEVRGLLCFNCNSKLAVLEDERWLAAALPYLGQVTL